MIEELKRDFEDVQAKQDSNFTNQMYEKWKSIFRNEVNLFGWKGKDKIIIEPIEYNGVWVKQWVVREHRKDKKSGDVATNNHIVDHEKVEVLRKIINLLCVVGESTKYRVIVKELMWHYDLDYNLEAFNGGKNRMKDYFPKYYYPIKILEKFNHIDYYGGGKVTRLK